MPKAPSLMLCEGPSDEGFIEALKWKRGGLDHVEVSLKAPDEARGWGGLRERLESQIGRGAKALSKYNALVLLVDNDDNPVDRVDAIRKKIAETEVLTPPAAAWMPSVRSNNFPPIHIVTLPDKNVPGSLETLLVGVLEARKVAPKQCADAYFTAVDAHVAKNLWSVSNKAKLKTRIELAIELPKDPLVPFGKIWCDEHGNPRDLFGLDDPCFDKLVNYLKAL